MPNSQPSRGNIEIEIYGMEGIPEADLKAHESSRGQVGGRGRCDCWTQIILAAYYGNKLIWDLFVIGVCR